MTRPLLSVIIPVYNEARTIDDLLARVLDSPLAEQVIVVDDGSTDGTADKLHSWRRKVIPLAHPQNRGKGAAIRTGLKLATGEYTLIQDGDLEYDPHDYRALLEPLLAGQGDAVYGSRYLRPQPWSLYRLGVSFLNVCVSRWYGLRLTDEATCYKMFRTADLKRMHLTCQRFEFCPEVTAKACRMGLRIVEVPISYQGRTKADGKKIRLNDGHAAVRTLWRYRRWQANGAKTTLT
jgi:glycosyltransferase involved in cell wall biosynthesis